MDVKDQVQDLNDEEGLRFFNIAPKEGSKNINFWTPTKKVRENLV